MKNTHVIAETVIFEKISRKSNGEIGRKINKANRTVRGGVR